MPTCLAAPRGQAKPCSGLKININARHKCSDLKPCTAAQDLPRLHLAPFLNDRFLPLAIHSHVFKMVTATNTGFPTLTNVPNINYPPPSVPPTADAPYMQASRLPEDFVFIVVGATLAFIAFIILAWRIIMAWSINRSFKRPSDTLYAPLPTPGGDMKKFTDKSAPRVQSSHGMSDLTLPKNFSQTANSSLFFSPTAEAARYSQRPPSQHLPAGHYRNHS